MRDLAFWTGSAVLIVAAYVLTLLVSNEYVFFAGYVILQFIVLATAWNILGGYAGYVNFGTAAFVGLGTYTSVALVQLLALPLPLQMLAAACIGAALGFATGLLTLRLRGIFYSIATVALTIVIETFIINWKFVGGAAGVQILRPPVTPPFVSYIQYLFVLGVVMAVISVAVARYIEGSWIGRGLKAVRDDELAAECSGVPTLRLKLIACALSGALMCAAGAPNPMYFQFAIPTAAFDLNYSVAPLAMSLIGGTAHWIGPVMGAIVLGITQQVLQVTISSDMALLALGVMLVLFVVAAPEGILGLMRRARGPGTAKSPVEGPAAASAEGSAR